MDEETQGNQQRPPKAPPSQRVSCQDKGPGTCLIGPEDGSATIPARRIAKVLRYDGGVGYCKVWDN